MNIFTKYTRTLLCAVGFIGAALATGCGGGDQGRDPVLGVPAASLVSVMVTPDLASVAIGATQQFVATAIYSDGSAKDVTANAAWSSGTPAVATMKATSGIAVGVDAGASVISAAFEGKNGSAKLTVLPAKLVSIAVAPAKQEINVGLSQQYMVMGTFDNNTTRDITAASTFASASPTVATISPTGLASAKTQGTAAISATSGGLSGSATLTVLAPAVMSLAVTPAATTLQIRGTRQLAVFATYSDASVVDVTSSTSFASATPAAVGVGTGGLMTGVAAGSSVITANFSGKSATASATTSPAVLSSITVTPANARVRVGGIQQFVAVANYSDNSTAVITTSANWTSASTGVATVLSTGVATGNDTGTTTIKASADGQSGSATLTVVEVAPPPVSTGINLRSAANFAVLAGTSLTNNAGGTTLITGDVGSPSQTTDPTQTAGYTNYKSGAILSTALADLQTAITDANARNCDVTFAGDIDLGGLVLAPGVYCYAGAISVTGTLSLNGAGDYIFRTALTLNTTANSVIALTNGANAENVSWVPVGPTTLGANSVFKGSILEKSAAITVGDNTTLLNGRVLSGRPLPSATIKSPSKLATQERTRK
jgi:hypothetical protein